MSTDWEETTEAVIGSAFIVSNVLGAGFLEKVYENALAHELRKTGRHVEQQRTVDVHYDQQVVGRFVADLVVDHRVLVEMKSARGIDEVHMAQCINYLKATSLPVCLLLNFGRPKVQVKRILNPHVREGWVQQSSLVVSD